MRSGKGGKRPTYGSKRRVRSAGYVDVWRPGHPLAHSHGYVPEHRLVLYEAGVVVPATAHVHHKNGDKADNRLENLEVLTNSEHQHRHRVPGSLIRNQYGVFPVMTPEARLEKARARSREYQRQLRQALKARQALEA